MHAGVAAQARRPALGIKADVQPEQGQRHGGEQGCIGREPDRHLIGQQQGGDGRRRRPPGAAADAAACEQTHGQRGDERIEQVRQARGPGVRADDAHHRAGSPVRQRRFFAERLARQQGNRLGGLPTHPPGDVGFAWFVGRPITPAQYAGAHRQRQGHAEQNARRSGRVTQGRSMGGIPRRISSEKSALGPDSRARSLIRPNARNSCSEYWWLSPPTPYTYCGRYPDNSSR